MALDLAWNSAVTQRERLRMQERMRENERGGRRGKERRERDWQGGKEGAPTYRWETSGSAAGWCQARRWSSNCCRD